MYTYLQSVNRSHAIHIPKYLNIDRTCIMSIVDQNYTNTNQQNNNYRQHAPQGLAKWI